MSSQMYKVGFFILIAMNVLLVLVFTLKPAPSHQRRDKKDELGNELRLSEEQKLAFDEMVINHREAIHHLENQERELLSSFFEQLSPENQNENKEALLQEILQVEKDKIMITFNHFEELRGICSEEQLTKFDKVIQQAFPMMKNSGERPNQHGRSPH